MREAQGVMINPLPRTPSLRRQSYCLLLAMLNSCYLSTSVASFLHRNPDQHASRKIGSDAAVCPEETSLLL